tara:strand:+ start:9558 stop:9929 length:372 start_codon:yes stop_codon:yes gene_type:complete
MSKSMAPDESGYGYYESDNGTITITTQDTQDYTFHKNTYSIDDTVTVSLDTDNTFSISDKYDPMYDININSLPKEEFVDELPDIKKINEMCKDYPALDKVYEQFKTIYHMVHQDYAGKKKIKG